MRAIAIRLPSLVPAMRSDRRLTRQLIARSEAAPPVIVEVGICVTCTLKARPPLEADRPPQAWPLHVVVVVYSEGLRHALLAETGTARRDTRLTALPFAVAATAGRPVREIGRLNDRPQTLPLPIALAIGPLRLVEIDSRIRSSPV